MGVSATWNRSIPETVTTLHPSLPPRAQPPHRNHRTNQANTSVVVSTVYPSGLVCISILHAPGDDPHHYEKASERWSPIQSVEKILISVMSMLAEPNDESPANIEAAKMWRERRDEFERTVRNGVRRSLGV